MSSDGIVGIGSDSLQRPVQDRVDEPINLDLVRVRDRRRLRCGSRVPRAQCPVRDVGAPTDRRRYENVIFILDGWLREMCQSHKLIQ